MIIYRCDISGRDLTLEEVQECEHLKLEYAQTQGWAVEGHAVINHTAYNSVCDNSFYFHPDYAGTMPDYWDDKKAVLIELSQNWASRIMNHRKSFFKSKRKGNGAIKAVENES